MNALTRILTLRHPGLALLGVGLVLVGVGIGIRPRP